MTASQMRIAETIDAFYGDAGTKDGVSRSYKQAVEDLDAETIKALDGPYRYAKSPQVGGFVLMQMPAIRYWSPYHDSAPTSPTLMTVRLLLLLQALWQPSPLNLQTQASKSGTTSYSTMTPNGLRRKSLRISQTRTQPSCPVRKGKQNLPKTRTSSLTSSSSPSCRSSLTCACPIWTPPSRHSSRSSCVSVPRRTHAWPKFSSTWMRTPESSTRRAIWIAEWNRSWARSGI